MKIEMTYYINMKMLNYKMHFGITLPYITFNLIIGLA